MLIRDSKMFILQGADSLGVLHEHLIFAQCLNLNIINRHRCHNIKKKTGDRVAEWAALAPRGAHQAGDFGQVRQDACTF